jgi:hypothetical protein
MQDYCRRQHGREDIHLRLEPSYSNDTTKARSVSNRRMWSGRHEAILRGSTSLHRPIELASPEIWPASVLLFQASSSLLSRSLFSFTRIASPKRHVLLSLSFLPIPNQYTSLFSHIAYLSASCRSCRRKVSLAMQVIRARTLTYMKRNIAQIGVMECLVRVF